MLTKLSVAAIITIVLVYGPAAAIATPFFSAEARSGTFNLPPVIDSHASVDGSTVSGHTELSGVGMHAESDAVAGGGFLGGKSSTSSNFAPGMTRTVSEAETAAEFTVSLFTPCPAGAVVCTGAPTSINFALHGVFAGNTPVGMNAEGSVTVGVRVSKVSSFGNSLIFNQNGSVVVDTVPGAGLQLRQDLPPDGLLAGYVLNQNLFSFTTADFFLDPDSEYALTVFMNTFNQSPIRSAFTDVSNSDLDIDFGSTLTFGPGPVFNGNPDFDISAPDANILNNTWTDPRGGSVPVSEHATIAMFGAGLGMMGLLRRRKKGEL
jgi:hypothetical protein